MKFSLKRMKLIVFDNYNIFGMNQLNNFLKHEVIVLKYFKNVNRIKYKEKYKQN